MSHHGQDYPGSFLQGQEIDREKLEQLKSVIDAKEDLLKHAETHMALPSFGATGKYPEGKLNENDEGGIVFGIATDNAKIVLNFGKPVSWIGMTPTEAVQLATSILNKALPLYRNEQIFS